MRPSVRSTALAAALIVVAGVRAAGAADDRDALARARQLYDQRQFDAAIAAADQARATPARANSADLIAARAYLERFRDGASGDDLASARERLLRLDPQRFAPAERVDYIVGLGESLYLEGLFGAAAELFWSVLPDTLAPLSRERVLDWWATAVDRDAKPRPEIERQVVYQRIRARMEEELWAHPESGAAAYWISAAARGQGDLEAAWHAAEAGWVRAPLTSDRGAALRADLDRLVQRAIIPERARALAQPPDTLRQEWERFKGQWTR